MAAAQKITTSKIIIAYFVWWLVWALFVTYALTSTIDIPFTDALLDAANTSLILATAGYFIFNALRSYQPGLSKSFSIFVWTIVLSVLCVMLQRYLVIHYPYWHSVTYLEFFSGSLVLRGLFIWIMITLITILCWIWFYVQEQQANEKRQEDMVALAREAELSKLRQQLQPHFLFNSLNSISALAGSKPEEARKMIQQLSDFLRGTLKKDDQQQVPLNEELHQLQLYLEIEKVRFGHRLQTAITRDAETENMTLPPLLLQPIVENAIKFGLYDTIGAIMISIAVRAEKNFLHIEVKNPFDIETSAPQQGTGFGLNSIQRRLYLMYARNDLLTIAQHENIFITTIKIPQPV